MTIRSKVARTAVALFAFACLAGMQPAAQQELVMEPLKDSGLNVYPAFEGWYQNADGSYTLLDKAGKELLKGTLGDRHVLPEGRYEITYERSGKPTDKKSFWINTDVVTHVTVRLLKK